MLNNEGRISETSEYITKYQEGTLVFLKRQRDKDGDKKTERQRQRQGDIEMEGQRQRDRYQRTEFYISY